MIRTAPVFAVVVALLALPATFARAESRLLRQPTYSNGRVAFSYLGDLWVASDDGSNVHRLTDHLARDVFPRFSPDGKWVAFSSNREGNFDVYVMSADGGKPKQLTFHSADDNVVGWSPDGKKVLFTSTRGVGAFPSVATLFEIPADGGMEQPMPLDWGSSASYSPDGSKLAFTRHPGVWSRKHYRGSYAVDLWLMDVADKQFRRLGDSDYKGNYLWPMFGNDGQIYFVADRLPDEKDVKYGSPEVMKSTNNIWRIPASGGPPVQVTHHSDGNLFFPSISADGKTIVYEDNFRLWKLDTASGKNAEIPIDIKSDVKENEDELRTIQGEAETFDLSPSGKRAAVSTHGEIFTIATDRGEVQRVTESFWRDQYPQWSPDGKSIAFVSDRSGREEIWIADERGHNPKKITDFDCDKSAAVWAPDSKSLLWAGSDHKLRRVVLDGGETEELTSSDVGPIGTPQFSPDGKWVSYSKQDHILRSRVYVRRIEGGDEKDRTEHMIGAEDFLTSSGAKWTLDGKKLLLLGGAGAPSMASLQRTSQQLYSVSLTRVTKKPDDRDVDTEEQAQSANDGPRAGRGPGGGGGGASTTKPSVKIEWDGLDRRMKQLTRLGGGSVTTVEPSPDSRTYAFVAYGGGSDEDGEGLGGPSLYTISEDGTRVTRLSQTPTETPSEDAPPQGRRGGGRGGIGQPHWSRDGRTIYYMQGNGIYAIAAPSAPAGGEGGPPSTGGGFFGRGRRGDPAATAPPTAGATTSGGATPRRISFTVRLEIDQAAERRQVFEEAWRVMRNRFYDPKMHGVDWDAAKETYQPLLADVADTDELHNVIMQMIGELNASHTGISGGGGPGIPQERAQTRYPGFDLEPDNDAGYYKVGHIYKKGPADHDYVKLEKGNYILAVNGKELKTSDNYWKVFNLAFGRKFEFTVNSKPETDGAWTVSIEPLSATAQSNLDYQRWVDTRKATVAKLTDGQVGYLHIKAMDGPSFAKFQRDLLDNLDKKALIIDERFNGGGGIDQELLEILNQRKRYQSWRGRDSVEVPRPVQAFFGPMVVLQNERSASNAEMFPEGFRTLGLGKVIGVPTYGAVIGTGAYRLLDGSSIRTPGFGVYTATGASLENYGVQPDVWADNTPADFLAGHDRQIEKAVEVLKGEMK